MSRDDDVRTLDVSSVLNKCLAFYFPADKNMSRDSTGTERSAVKLII